MRYIIWSKFVFPLYYWFFIIIFEVIQVVVKQLIASHYLPADEIGLFKIEYLFYAILYDFWIDVDAPLLMRFEID